MANKHWVVDFKFPTLAASHYWQSTTVQAANIGMAINRAWAVVKTRPAVKGRRIDQANVSVKSVKEGDTE